MSAVLTLDIPTFKAIDFLVQMTTGTLTNSK